eukprot:scaffold242478_cov13-Tisochrysis_lutea.AAC.1
MAAANQHAGALILPLIPLPALPPGSVSCQGVAAATQANSHCHYSGPPGTQHSDVSTAQVRAIPGLKRPVKPVGLAALGHSCSCALPAAASNPDKVSLFLSLPLQYVPSKPERLMGSQASLKSEHNAFDFKQK